MRKLFTTFLLLLVTIVMYGQQVSESDAAQRARSFWAKPMASRQHRAMSTAQPKLAYVAKVADEVHFYVFNNANGEGFVIVGGDETAQQILGYSYKGTFDYDRMPANVKWWLSQYERDIHQGIAMSKTPGQLKVASSKTKADVEQLISTRWNQDFPYNSAIPNLEGADGDDRFATGCVATAMAQVMNKHAWPDSIGTGSNSYQKIYNTEDTIVFSADFSKTKFEWSKMRDDYGNWSTSEEVSSIGKLMYALGVSVNMDYGKISEGGSSAYNESVGTALINYFGYDKGLSFVKRAFYTDEAWEDIVYNELVAGRPVFYGGRTKKNEGHAFVICGYRASDDTYNVNWGWGGYYDGNYALSGSRALSPYGSGIGGGTTGEAYTEEQTAYLGIRPDVGNDYVWQMSTLYPYEMINKDGQKVNNIKVDKRQGDQNVKMSLKVYNQSLMPNSFSIGLLLVDENTKQSKILENVAAASNLACNSGIGFDHTLSTSMLKYDGVYSVYPVFRLASSSSVSDWKRMTYPVSMTTPTITITGGELPDNVSVDFKISASAMKEETSVNITYNSNYEGKVTTSVDKEGIVSISQSKGVVTLTGKKPGIVNVTVKAEPYGYYAATERTFEVTVTEVPVVPVAIEINGTDLTVGNTLKITHDPEYDGQMTYSCDKEGIVSIDSMGVVTGLADGTVRITATAEGSRFFTRTTVYFDVTVTSEPKSIYLLDVEVSQNGCFTADGLKIKATFKNNSGKTVSNPMLQCKLSAGYMQMPFQMSFFGEYKQGSVFSYEYDFSQYLYMFTTYAAGVNDYLVEFSDVATSKVLEPLEKATFHLTLCDKIEVKAELNEAGWGTLLLPFDADIPSGMNAYQCSEYKEGYVLPTKVTNGKIKMDTPYLIEGKSSSYSFSGPQIPNKLDEYASGILVGVMQKDTVPANSYVLETRDSVTAFYKISADDTILVDAYKAYLTLPTEGNTNDAFYLTEKDYREYGKLPDLTVYVNIAEDGWGTMMLPFDAVLPDSIYAYQCSDYTDGYVNLTEVTDSTLTKNTPYIISGAPGMYEFVGPQDRKPLEKSYQSGIIVGVTKNDTIPADSYLLATRDSLTALYHVGKSDTICIDAFTAYFSIPKKEGASEASSMYYLSEEDYNSHNVKVLLGDANGDGEISVADLSLMAAYVLGNSVDINEVNADVNGDGNVSVADLSAVAGMILSK